MVFEFPKSERAALFGSDDDWSTPTPSEELMVECGRCHAIRSLDEIEMVKESPDSVIMISVCRGGCKPSTIH